jgi:hypothetical protein
LPPKSPKKFIGPTFKPTSNFALDVASPTCEKEGNVNKQRNKMMITGIKPWLYVDNWFFKLQDIEV